MKKKIINPIVSGFECPLCAFTKHRSFLCPKMVAFNKKEFEKMENEENKRLAAVDEAHRRAKLKELIETGHLDMKAARKLGIIVYGI